MMYAIWPGGETCSMEEVADFETMLQSLGDDYYIDNPIGYDNDGYPVFRSDLQCT